MKIDKIFIFVFGAAAGSLITWKIVEEKYKQIADEEIASVIEQFKKRFDELENRTSRADFDEDINMCIEEKEKDKYKNEDEYKEKLEKLGYSIGIDISEENDHEVKTDTDYIKPYVISPEEFGEFGNDTKCLTYYSDFVLVDDDDDIIVDPENLIGDALEHFGEYEDDSVHVRNEVMECDFEILKSEKTFSEVYKEDN